MLEGGVLKCLQSFEMSLEFVSQYKKRAQAESCKRAIFQGREDVKECLRHGS